MKLYFRPRLIGANKMRQWLFWLFPLFLNAMLGLNLVPSPWLIADSPRLIIDSASISRFVLSALVLLLLYVVLCAITRRPYIAAAALSVPLFVISIWDFYKFYSLGTRVAAEDIPMIFSIGDMWTPKGASPSTLFFSPMIFATGLLLFLYIRRLKTLHVEYAVPQLKKRVGSALLAVWLMVSLSQTSFAYQIFVPQVGAYEAITDSQDEAPVLTSIDCLIGSIYYDEFEDARATKENIDHMIAGYSAQPGSDVRPDIIVIMSESFFDLNRAKGVRLNEDIYTNFRKMQEFSGKNKIAVPAFGGGTACTEFEVLSGTSNVSLKSTRAPYGKIKEDTDIPTYQSYFSDLGYSTTYIHPYKSTFYNRNIAMQAMGFDKMIFQDDLTVAEQDYARDMHISDATLTDQIIDVLQESSSPNFIFATSMQNHSPYVTLDESDPDIVQLENPDALAHTELSAMNAYAVGIRDTDAALGRLIDYANNAEKPTAILFFGDHQPLLEGYKTLNNIENDNIYSNIENITTEYAYYANYDVPNTKIAGAEDEKIISSYYLMNVFLTALDMPKTQYMSVLDDAIRVLPVYTNQIEYTRGDLQEQEYVKMLVDVLSYDRVFGEQYSAQPE